MPGLPQLYYEICGLELQSFRSLVSVLKISNYLVGLETHPDFKLDNEMEIAYSCAIEELNLSGEQVAKVKHAIVHALRQVAVKPEEEVEDSISLMLINVQKRGV
jgi:hypothetical protein